MNPADLDSKYGYIQVSFVTPYFEEKELQERVTDFERNNTIRRFMYETPFTKGTQAQGTIEEQYKRRTILVSELFVFVLSLKFEDPCRAGWDLVCAALFLLINEYMYMQCSSPFRQLHASF